MILSISDGMGSGPSAYRESEQVIELLEQFLEAGFRKETAVRLIHAALMLQDNGSFSSIDLCTVDLFTGLCEFLKIGAAATFLRRTGWVEEILSTSAPVGLTQEIEMETVKRQLEPGNFVVMVSDGVLDSLPQEDADGVLKEIVAAQETENAAEMAENIIKEVLRMGQCRPEDDMTVLVGGFWER